MKKSIMKNRRLRRKMKKKIKLKFCLKNIQTSFMPFSKIKSMIKMNNSTTKLFKKKAIIGNKNKYFQAQFTENFFYS